MPTLRDHQDVTFQRCRRITDSGIGCGGFVFWSPGDGPAAKLGLEGCCSHCGALWYTGDILSGATVVQPIQNVQRRGGPRLPWDASREQKQRRGWTRMAGKVA